MPVSLSSLIQACRAAFDRGEYALVLELSALLCRAAPDRVEPWSVRAEALIALERPQEALPAYAMALERGPQDGDLWVRYGRALARCGQHQQALAAFEAAFAAEPSRLSALHDLLAYRAVQPGDPALQMVRAMAEGAPATPGARAFACFLLGRIHTAAGLDQEGFRYYATANRLSHQALAAAPPLRGPQEFQRWWLPRLQVGGEGLPVVSRGAGEGCPALLITGLPRSGKSLVEHLLSAHPSLAAGAELGGLHEVVESGGLASEERLAAEEECRDGQGLAEAPLRCLERLAGQPEDPLAGLYRQALAAAGRPAAQWILDTAPAHLWDLGYLAALQPQVPLILCRRDPLDLGAAIFFKRFRQGHAYSYDQRQLGAMLALAEQAIDLWRRHLPNPIQLVDYDTLVADPIGERDRLLRGLGLDPGLCSGSPALDGAASAPPPLHPSHSAEGYGPIRADLSGFARRFAEPLAPMREAFQQGMAAAEAAAVLPPAQSP